METTPPASTGTPKPPPRKRRRPAVVCSECRRRKIACDRKVPCGQCALHKTECVYRNDIVHSKAAAQHPRASTSVSVAGNAGGSSGGVSAGPSPPVSFLELVASGESHPRWPPDTTLYHHKGTRNDDETSATEPDSSSITIGQPMMRQEGRLAKSRFFGPSHWMNSLDQYVQLHRLAYMALGDSKSELFVMLRKCKVLAQAIKADEKRAIQNPKSDFFIPPRDVADALVDIYVESFESVHRILHIPTFRREYHGYWVDPASSNDLFKHKLLLVLALGSLFYDGPEELKDSVRLAATQAVYKSGAWLCTPQDKHHISLGLLQVYCLVLIARHSMAIDLQHDLDYISTGSLLHTAFNMGFSRDPSGFVGLPIFLIEMRRRLWATILELYLQSSMDLGLYPMVSLDDTNCKPPSNLDDDELHENMSAMPAHANDDSHFTQTTLQRILVSTYPLRLQIAKRLNGFGRALSYEEVLQLSRELTTACRSYAALLHSLGKAVTPSGSSRPSEFGVAVLDILTRRFLLSLHAPFARRSSTNVELYYSRSVSVEISLKLLTHFPTDSMTDPHRPPIHPYLQKLWIRGRGLWKSVFSDAISTVCFELIQQLEDDPSSPLSLAQREILGYVRASVEITRKRVEYGETNVKGYTFFAAGLAHIDAVLAGEPVEGRVISVAIKSMNESYEMLKAIAERRGVAVPGGDPAEQPQPPPEDAVVTGTSLLDGNIGAAGAGSTTINIHELSAALDPQQPPPDQWMEFYDVDFENPPISWFFPEVNMTMAENINEDDLGVE